MPEINFKLVFRKIGISKNRNSDFRGFYPSILFDLICKTFFKILKMNNALLKGRRIAPRYIITIPVNGQFLPFTH